MSAGSLFPVCSSSFFLSNYRYNISWPHTHMQLQTQIINSQLSYRNPPPFFFTVKKSHSSSPLCLSSSSSPSPTSYTPSTRLYVSGLSFRTTEDSLRNAFKIFGELLEVNLVMDKIANRPRGFAFLRYATEEESQQAIDGMHGKFLDGRVIFVEIAKSRSELRRGLKEDSSKANVRRY